MNEDLNIKVLRYFLTIAELKSFTLASNELFISQPTLSKYIRELEKQLGEELFIRSNTGLSLTPYGEFFLGKAQLLVSQYDTFLDNISSYGSSQYTGKLRIGYQRMAKNPMRRVNKGFTADYPLVKFTYQILATTNPLDILLSDQCDCIYVYKSEVENSNPSLFRMQFISSCEFGVIYSEDHKRLSKLPAITIADLRNERFVMPKRHVSPAKHDEIYNACREAGFSPDVIGRYNTIEDSTVFLGTHDAVTIIPATIYDSIASNDIAYTPLTNYPHRFDLVLAALSANDSPVLDAYFKKASEYFPE